MQTKIIYDSMILIGSCAVSHMEKNREVIYYSSILTCLIDTSSIQIV